MKKDKIIRGMVIVFLCSVNICGLEAQEKAGECVPLFPVYHRFNSSK